MGTNTGIGIGIGIPFRNNALGGDNIYFPPELKARMIGIWDNYGKKNTDADRNIIKNKIPNAGGDLEILNAAYEGMSGCNGYPVVFGANKTWENLSSVYSYTSDVTSTTIHITRVKNAGTGLLFSYVKKDGALTNIRKIPAFRVTVKGLEGNSKFGYRYLATEDATVETLVYLGNGTHELSKSFAPTEALLDLTRNAWVGIFITPMVEGEVVFDCDITIEVLPEYEGAFVTDGVNDMIISQKTIAEMGITDEVTIVSMIHQITLNSTYNLATTNYIENSTTKEHVRTDVYAAGKTGIYGYTASLINSTRSTIGYILGDIRDYQAVGTTNKQTILDSKFSVVGRVGGFTELSSVAHYWTFAVLGKATADEINLIIAKYNLDRTLRPDILCNITKQGITNDNHADFNDRLIDYSGNGRDIQMYNLAWKDGSGIAAKPYETIKDYKQYEDNLYQEVIIHNEFSYTTKSKLADRYWAIQSNRKDDESLVVTIITDKDCEWICNFQLFNSEGVQEGNLKKKQNVFANTPTEVTIAGRGYFEIPEGYTAYSAASYINLPYSNGEVTVTFIPSCKGGILLDGINDFGKVIDMPIYKDYTFIIDYERISYASSERWVAGVVSKSHVANQGAFILMTANTTVEPGKQAYSFGGVTSFNRDDFTRALVYQSKYKCGDVDLTVGEGVDSNTLWLGTFRDNDQRFFNGAIYSLMSFPYSMSEFLIERQLKKHKLGTLYPNMMEFRPIIKSNIDTLKINYWDKDWNVVNVGDYVSVGNDIKTNITVPNGYKVSKVTSDAFDNITIEKSSTDFIYDVKFYGIKKSPQKISITIEQDENYVLFNPVINSNYKYISLDFFLNNYQKKINIGDYIPKDAYLRANLYLNNNVDEPAEFTFNGVSIGYSRSIMADTAFNIKHIYNYDSPQEVNITIDEYIRYEDIVQPYPVLLRFNDENGNEVSWGGKFRVGSTITRIGSAADSNLLPNIYNIFGLLLNDNQVTSSKVIVEKTMVFKAKSAYIFDNNEPNCILSPRLLRIPNSSYKILGYIPDISGHGNHGVIHNSAYAKGSGVNEDGSYQFDGVDDFVTIPTLSSGGKQVLMKVNWDKTIADAILYDQRGYPNEFAIYNADVDNNNNPVFAYQARNNGQTYIDGILNKNIKASELRAITHNITITNELSTGTNTSSPVIGSNRVHDAYFTNMALYDFMLFDNISTEDKIKELNEYVGIEAKVELPPYYWDAYGKTNLDEDKATIQQRGVAEGDYDITNYNHAYDKMSGYGGYNLGRFDKSWASSSSSNTSIKVVQRNPYDITLKKLGGNSDWEFNNTELKVISNPVSVKFKSNKNIRVTCDYHYYPVGGNSEGTPLGITSKDLIANKDAIITISPISQENIDKYNIDVNRGYYLIYFQLSSTLAVNEEVTIEMLPLYPNGLVYDGVTDYSENANIPALTDYTYIFKREFLSKTTGSASMYKGEFFANGGMAFIADYAISDGSLYGFSYRGQAKVNSLNTDKIIYGTKTSVNGSSITPNTNIDTAGLTMGKFDSYRKMVFYKLILYPKTIPLLQINFLKNLMERDEIIDLNNPIFKNESNAL